MHYEKFGLDQIQNGYINNPTHNCLNQILIRRGSSWTYVVLLQ